MVPARERRRRRKLRHTSSITGQLTLLERRFRIGRAFGPLTSRRKLSGKEKNVIISATRLTARRRILT